ncbi:hypothetical protein [Halopiger aswanensis]|nr:hypothetical protein [Halopiger aswanensis]
MDERMQVQYLRVNRRSDQPPAYDGQFTTVYYLDGDERMAAKKFVEENRAQLKAIDFSHPDPVQRAVPREVYDWILHFLGERKLRKYQNIVYEQRRSGTEWVIDRDHFETYPNDRYRPTSTAAVAKAAPLESVYRDLGTVITESDLEAHDAIEGCETNVLEYYRVAGPFDCEPVISDGALAVKKRS